MAYKFLFKGIGERPRTGDWQLRISVMPQAIDKHVANNQLEAIKRILRKILKDKPLDVKIWEADGATDLCESYDATTSHQGMPGDQRGKEICIYVPDSSAAMSTPEYKEMLLRLWAELEKAGILLQYRYIPGEAKILGPSGMLTPFSFTSVHPPELPREWDNPHDIIFKKFIPYEINHPLLKIEFTKADLARHGIVFNARTNYLQRFQSYEKDRKFALQLLHKDLTAFTQQHNDYQTILNDNILITRIKELLAEFDAKRQAITNDDDTEACNQRTKLSQEFLQQIQQDAEWQLLLQAYPRQEKLAIHDKITHLMRLKDATSSSIDIAIAQLRSDYQDNVAHITEGAVNNFMSHADRTNPREGLYINWADYIEDYTPELLNQLIAKNPAGVQVIYRRIVALEREKLAQQQMDQEYQQLSVPNAASVEPQPIGVLDIDNTIIMSHAQSTGTVYNENLLQAIVKSGMKKVFLCTDMIFDRKNVLERIALCEQLAARGIRVLGVITPADHFWNVADAIIGDKLRVYSHKQQNFRFLENEVKQGKLTLDFDTTHSVGHAFADAANMYHDDYQAYKKYHAEYGGGQDLVSCIEQYITSHGDPHVAAPTEMQKLLLKSQNCKMFAGLQANSLGMPHVKGLLFNDLLGYHSCMQSLVFFDDNEQAVAAVAACARKTQKTHAITTKLVDGRNKDSQADYDAVLQEHAAKDAKYYALRKLELAIAAFAQQHLDKQQNNIGAQTNVQLTRQALSKLYDDLSEDICSKIAAQQSLRKIQQSRAFAVAIETATLLHLIGEKLAENSDLEGERNDSIATFISCYKKYSFYETECVKFKRAIACVLAAVAGLALGALVGACMGMALGVWDNLAAAINSSYGLFTGTHLASIVLAATITVLVVGAATSLLTGVVVGYGFFAPTKQDSKFKDDTNNVAQECQSLALLI